MTGPLHLCTALAQQTGAHTLKSLGGCWQKKEGTLLRWSATGFLWSWTHEDVTRTVCTFDDRVLVGFGDIHEPSMPQLP